VVTLGATTAASLVKSSRDRNRVSTS